MNVSSAIRAWISPEVLNCIRLSTFSFANLGPLAGRRDPLVSGFGGPELSPCPPQKGACFGTRISFRRMRCVVAVSRDRLLSRVHIFPVSILCCRGQSVTCRVRFSQRHHLANSCIGANIPFRHPVQSVIRGFSFRRGFSSSLRPRPAPLVILILQFLDSSSQRPFSQQAG